VEVRTGLNEGDIVLRGTWARCPGHGAAIAGRTRCRQGRCSPRQRRRPGNAAAAGPEAASRHVVHPRLHPQPGDGHDGHAGLRGAGLFSYQRLSIDQFPNIDIPTVVVQMDYPGASPEIVEAEVTKKVEEAVNTVAGIDTHVLALVRRQLGGRRRVQARHRRPQGRRRRAREGRWSSRCCATRSRTPRISRFDPASQPVFNVAVLSPDGSKSRQELTTWATQVLQKRWRTCAASARSASSAACSARSTSTCARPALEAFGVGIDQVVAALRSENQELPLGAIRSRERERVVQVNARMKSPSEFRDIVVTRRGGNAVKLWQLADVVDGPQEVESLALYNGQRTVLLSVQKSQGENTIEVVDGLRKALDEARSCCRPA
jgi:HAE1 family hydrophobic/amphiphilic exporter-1